MSSPAHTTSTSYDHPIYDHLVLTLGDAVTAAQAAADGVQREAVEALDWTSLYELA
ncbi:MULTISPECIES: hypothetical protein [unclassified Streptomyces]|uniref:hypothetical protein n=1 Tax=unclassified Streptomyces TaxID=2593676 RepID=UPI0019550620|nr:MULTISPECIES: hypothetical protein [unclassified Streptomyces]